MPQQHYCTQQNQQHQMTSFTTAHFMTACSSVALGPMETNRPMLESVVARTAQTEVCVTLTDGKTEKKKE